MSHVAILRRSHLIPYSEWPSFNSSIKNINRLNADTPDSAYDTGMIQETMQGRPEEPQLTYVQPDMTSRHLLAYSQGNKSKWMLVHFCCKLDHTWLVYHTGGMLHVRRKQNRKHVRTRSKTTTKNVDFRIEHEEHCSKVYRQQPRCPFQHAH